MLTPEKALVRPCVVAKGGSSPLPLEAVIRPMVERGIAGPVAIAGGRGSGKTTALRHLMAVVPESDRIVYMDDRGWGEINQARRTSLVVYTCPPAAMCLLSERNLAVLRLSPWGVDEWIEYLLAAHPHECASVMARMRDNRKAVTLQGSPLLLRIVLDALAADPRRTDLKAAISRFMRAHLGGGQVYRDATTFALNRMFGGDPGKVGVRLRDSGCDPRCLQAIEQPIVQLTLALGRIVEDLVEGSSVAYLAQRFNFQLIKAVGRNIEPLAAATGRLEGVLRDKQDIRLHATAAGMLTSMPGGWMPRDMEDLRLFKACLVGARWNGVRLMGADMHSADLSRADLRDSCMERVNAAGATFVRANLSGALLRKFLAIRATFDGADLSYVRADDADLSYATFVGANLEGALLRCVILAEADLSEARLVRANLAGAVLSNVNLDGADLSGACLDRAVLTSVDVRGATLVGVTWHHADAAGCNFEEQQLPGAEFSGASLKKALFTGSFMPRALFRDADLSEAGLAYVEWEGVDLQGANLSNVSFHLGSSRSGLVGSPIASEGTRTGFYTDDFDEQSYRPPEEIRKANLRGADLRGANVADTDFYLADLRDAKYDAEQEAHFRRCGAILHAKV